ncbi:MAG TPA: diaminopimelate epimerase, partial [Parafilimonas sp.]|nr:diaminopimelate epimerase [Parafilimonas sp.]
MAFLFYKYHGTGNDFIIIDNRSNNIVLSELQIKKLCDRHFGIGADGLMLMNNHPDYDFEMKYYNS